MTEDEAAEHYFAKGEEFAGHLRSIIDMMLEGVPLEHHEDFWEGIYDKL